MKFASRVLVILIGIAIPAFAFGKTTPAPAAAPVPATPARSSDNMEGLAAVYSDKLAGRKTASGEVFSQSKLTAAHPSLPFGTMVKVTSTKNNKSVEVRINDRGPTQAVRVVDMSSAAATKIGLGKKRMTPVKLEVIKEAREKGQEVGRSARIRGNSSKPPA